VLDERVGLISLVQSTLFRLASTNLLSRGFSKVERDAIAGGIFTSVKYLARKLRRYINAYSANAKPIQRKYSDPTRPSAVKLSLRHATRTFSIHVLSFEWSAR
jgi:hypothetical protein